jgi:hypothetical protein
MIERNVFVENDHNVLDGRGRGKEDASVCLPCCALLTGEFNSSPKSARATSATRLRMQELPQETWINGDMSPKFRRKPSGTILQRH